VCLDFAHVSTELVNGLAQLPSLQRMQVIGEVGEVQTASAWASLRSLREIQLDQFQCLCARKLLPVLHAVPSLRLLRWRCRAPTRVSVVYLDEPQLASLRPLLTAALLLQVELLLPRTFDEWQRTRSDGPNVSEEVRSFQQRALDELHQQPTQLPRVRIVEDDLTDVK
jgi:hypothetical protein